MNKKTQKIERMIYIILTIIVAYFVTFVNMDKIDDWQLLWGILLIVAVIILSYFFTPRIFNVYKWVINKLLKKYKIELKIFYNPILLLGVIISIFCLIYIMLINYYSLKLNKIPFTDGETFHHVLTSARQTAPIISGLINYSIKLSIILILLYQLYKLYKLKTPFIRSLSAILISMVGLLFLFDVFVFALDFTHFGNILWFIIILPVFIILGKLLVEYIDKKAK